MSHDPFQDFVLQAAHNVVTENPVGLFVTIGTDGFPTSRWCLGTPAGDLRRVFMLTRRGTRKLKHIELHAQCSWVFVSSGHDDTVTVYGRARVMDSFLEADVAWDQLLEKLKKFEAGPIHSRTDHNIVAIEVVVHRVELLSPRLKMNTTTVVGLGPFDGDHPQAMDMRISPEIPVY